MSLEAVLPNIFRRFRGVDFLGRDRGAQPLAGVAEQLAAQRFNRLEPGLERNEGLDHFAHDRVGLSDHAGLGHGGVFHQRAFHFERADQVAGRLDDIVATTHRRNTCGSARPHAGCRASSTATAS